MALRVLLYILVLIPFTTFYKSSPYRNIRYNDIQRISQARFKFSIKVYLEFSLKSCTLFSDQKGKKNPCGAISGTLYIPIHLSNWVMTVILWELFLEKAIFMYVLKGHAYCVLFGFLCLWGGTKATSEKNCHKANARKNTIVKMSKPCYRFFSLRSVSFGIDN